jgi:ABC-type Na+ efflux pump permease subunit
VNAIRAALRIAGLDLRDLARQRGTWMSLLLFPVINVVLIVILPGVLIQREQRQEQSAHYVVAVQGDAADVAALGPVLAPKRLDVVASSDAERAVRTKQAHAGLVVPPGAGVALRDGAAEALGEAQLRAVTLATRKASRAAVARVITTIEEHRAELAAANIERRGLPPAVIRPIDVQTVDLAATDRGARLALARLLPILLLLPLSGSLGLAAQRVSGGKDQRVLEPLLVLPVSRSVVLAGKAMSGYVLGMITLPAIALPLLLGRVVPVGGAGRHVALAPGSVAAVVLVAALLLILFVSVGACVGASARTSSEMGSLLPFLTFPIVLTALALNFLAVHTTLPFALIPVMGTALVARDIVAGTVNATAVALMALSTLTVALALIVGASRFLERERSVLRATS